jgi:hypothetical protein
MRSEDLKRMNKEYCRLTPIERVNVPSKVWGFEIDSANRLTRQIFQDLDETTLGIGWWAPYSALGNKARIFISDYLYQCGLGLEQNLIEARVHLLETQDLNDKSQKRTENLQIQASANERNL